MLGLLQTETPAATTRPSRPGLAAPLRIALRSTRILVRRVLGRDLGKMVASAADTPMFFALADDAAQQPHHSQAAAATHDAA
ncbi:hypothetical protein [Novosphingobium album (ex Liu et al. 2023)]|uniref:hypothetical protein n=1 Tax=Novosphingobium album (ex Liu et al. 2023) TaxID=3031130 RepID=UPI0023AF5A00|nr:hypothetical protein [Novosphingobium album (ex Liu et al. 2023)]